LEKVDTVEEIDSIILTK